MSTGPSPRDYRLIMRTGFDRDAPSALIFYLHGCGGSHLSTHSALADQFYARTGIDAITVGPSSAIVDASGNQDGQGSDGSKCWNLHPQWYDLPFVQQLLEHMLNNYCIDTRNIYFGGGSSGSFGSQGFGCYTQATAIAAGRGGVHHSSDVHYDFPDTPPPAANACGPIPTLLGFALGDDAVPYDVFAPVSREFWRQNNGCSDDTVVDEEARSHVCHSGVTGCHCERYQDCESPFVVCTWNGEHSETAISPSAQGWWYSQFVDGRDASTPPDPDPQPEPEPEPEPEPCEAAATNFIADFEVDSAAFPIQPYCDRCMSLGVTDGNGSLAELELRWSNGFDPRIVGDGYIEWIEERPGYTVRPFLRIEGAADMVRFSSSTNGVDYRIDLEAANALSGPVTAVLEEEGLLVTHSLRARTCN